MNRSELMDTLGFIIKYPKPSQDLGALRHGEGLRAGQEWLDLGKSFLGSKGMQV